MRDLKIGYVRHIKRIPPPISEGRLHYCEVTTLISGSMTYRVRGREYTLGASDAIFIPADTARERLASNVECDYVSFNFTGEVPELPTLIRGACHSELMLIISAMDKIIAKPHIAGNEKIEALFGVIIDLLSDYVRAEQLSPVTRKILDYLHREFRRGVSLEEIGRITFFSPGYCEALFRREVGRPIVDYASDLRISEAEKLILEGALPLAEIGRTVGFEDYNYFSRTFKRRTGYSPTAYRRSARS